MLIELRPEFVDLWPVLAVAAVTVAAIGALLAAWRRQHILRRDLHSYDREQRALAEFRHRLAGDATPHHGARRGATRSRTTRDLS